MPRPIKNAIISAANNKIGFLSEKEIKTCVSNTVIIILPCSNKTNTYNCETIVRTHFEFIRKKMTWLPSNGFRFI